MADLKETNAEWVSVQHVDCVACPTCAFTFDEFHTDADGRYSCPSCAERRLEAELAAAGSMDSEPRAEGALEARIRVLERLILEADTVATQRGDVFGLCDSIDNDLEAYPSQWAIDIVEGIRERYMASRITQEERP